MTTAGNNAHCAHPTCDVAAANFAFAFNLHALKVLAHWLEWARSGAWLSDSLRDGLGIRVDEINALLQSLDPRPPDPTTTEPNPPARAWEELASFLQSAAYQGNPLAIRWLDWTARTKCTPLQQRCLALLVAIAADHAVHRLARYAWADFGRASPPLGFVTRALIGSGDVSKVANHPEALRLCAPDSPLVSHALLHTTKDYPATALTDLGLTLHDETLHLVLGHLNHWPEWQANHTLPSPPQRLAKTLQRAQRRILHRGVALLPKWAVYGPPGCGRLAITSSLSMATRNTDGVWKLDLGAAVDMANADAAIQRALRHATLLNAVVAIYGFSRIPQTHNLRWIDAVNHAFDRATVPIVWILEDHPLPEMGINPDAAIPLGYPSKKERHTIWNLRLAETPYCEHAERFAGRFLITEGQIERCVEEANANLAIEASANFANLVEVIARREAAVGLGKLASPETKRVGLDQLVVDNETRTLLHEIISYTQHRDRLARDWGFERTLPYGLGVTALFAGPPGTGKTLAANAIASALDLELYRVDLSQLVSKFIGETEKHLSTLFTAAENGEVMLLFDEADSLFSKRTEVKSSVDRYANLEVNYLLQRIERFDGVVILTTNFEAGIDDAFARRIRFRVQFPEPDKKHRTLLWKMLTPKDVPLADDVDFRFLAEAYEVSGGHIKEIVLRAASLAMAETDNPKVTQELFIRSAEAEYRKLGKLVLTS